MRRRTFLKTSATGALAPLVLSSATASAAQTEPAKNPKVEQIRARIKPITKEERQERIGKAQRLMTEQKIDFLLLEGGTTLNYFTGINWGRSERLFAMLLPRSGKATFVAPKFEESRAQEQTGDARLLTWEEHESPFLLVKQAMADAGGATGTVGIEETVRHFVSYNLHGAVPQLSFVNGTSITAECRCTKSAHEIELMQIANDITAEVFTAAVPKLKAGMTEREFGRIISQLHQEFGVGGGALVLFGEASAHPHGLMKEHVLEENQIVLIDGGCSVEGYASDITRTTVFGTPSEKMKSVWQIVRKAQDAALAAARPGVPAEQIDAAARNVITDAGYGPDYKYFSHRLGHGIGMEGHEWYYLVRGNTRPEKVGETHSNEPGIYIPGEFGIRLEDEMLITEDGARLLQPQSESFDRFF